MKRNAADTADFHTQIAVEFDASYAHDSNRRERLRVWNTFLDRYATGTQSAYDLGCGSGAVTFELARYANRVTGIDGSSGMIEIARQHAAEMNLSERVRFFESKLPIVGDPKLEPAGLVISSSAIEYMDSIPQVLSFVRRILNPGGVLIFSMSNRASWSRKLVRLIHRLTGKPEYLTHLRHFVTAAELEAHLEAAGFAPLEHAYFGGADRINRVLGAVLPAPRANNMIIIVAKRRD